MLNSETKRKIDAARNILVGNVTNPISQVDQITNALIYKFMDDMDQENIDVDLKPQFFVGDYAKYAWSKLLDKKLSGQERMNLYIQATESMSKNPHIPQLFRDIFKGAFLPYNDPRVLTLFLKEIDGFSYSHSEELGNAFEYLLSILGSQGDAGQFRTPRHIIDFIAEVVDPKKNETILDPACGTAGFLISAYKHILKNHDGLDNKTGKPTNKEKNLTPDEKTKLMNNIVGYDVSPDMVKLSLVNMYLHGFQSPKIHKYNTLTDEKRWDEQFDVIMANPPFMTPKGGVETHKRFSIQANRAEVLFVDYIMEHLSINGRAGIIVPEGIIFKGDKAYKSLRKKLVEDGLFAVVSLPAGVFQPYSGVKTSILFFDNQVAKQTKEMLFVKIENDGYDLGAQRRKIDKNDLPKAWEILQAWKKGEKQESEMALWVEKEKIAESGDYNLTGERYREVEVYKNVKWNMVELGEVCEILRGAGLKKSDVVESGKNKCILYGQLYTTYGQIINNIVSTTNKTGTKLSVKGDVLIPATTTADAMGIAIASALMLDNIIIGGDINIFRVDKKKVNSEYLANLLSKMPYKKVLASYAKGSNIIHLSGKEIAKIKIPLPPLEVQKEIVEQIEVKQNAINNAREIIKSLERERRYFGQELRKLEGVKMVELGEVCKNLDSRRKPVTKSDRAKGEYPYYGASGIVDYVKDFIFDGSYLLISEDGANLLARSTPIAFSISGKVWVNNHAHILEFEEKATQKLIEFYVNSIDISEYVSGAAQPKLSQKSLNSIKIPLPPLAVQKQLVAEAEKEEEIITANKGLIEIMEKKIEKVIKEI